MEHHPPASQALAAVVPVQAPLHLQHLEHITLKAKASTAFLLLTVSKAAKPKMLRTAKYTPQGLETTALATSPTNHTTDYTITT